MKSWFAALESREKKFVLTAAVFLVLASLYFGIWRPLTKGHAQLNSSVEQWQSSLHQLAPLKARLGNSTATRISALNLRQPLVVVVDSTLRTRDLNSALKRSQPTGNNIRVEFENVAFDDLVLWLGDISTQYALQVQSGSFSMAGEIPGRVNAQLTLGR